MIPWIVKVLKWKKPSKMPNKKDPLYHQISLKSYKRVSHFYQVAHYAIFAPNMVSQSVLPVIAEVSHCHIFAKEINHTSASSQYFNENFWCKNCLRMFSAITLKLALITLYPLRAPVCHQTRYGRAWGVDNTSTEKRASRTSWGTFIPVSFLKSTL